MEDKRTIKQNDYLHAMFSLVRDGLRQAGFDEVKTKEDAKVICKKLFGVEKTSELSTKQFADFVAGVQKWASEYLGVYIPDPNQSNYFNDYNKG